MKYLKLLTKRIKFYFADMKYKKCKNCKLTNVVFIGADEPWHSDYWICPECDSTYNLWEY